MEIGNRTKSSEFTSEELRLLERAQRLCEQLIPRAEMNIYTNKKHCLENSTVLEFVDAEDEYNRDEVVQVAMLMTQSHFDQTYQTELTCDDRVDENHIVGHEYKLKIKLNENAESL